MNEKKGNRSQDLDQLLANIDRQLLSKLLDSLIIEQDIALQVNTTSSTKKSQE